MTSFYMSMFARYIFFDVATTLQAIASNTTFFVCLNTKKNHRFENTKKKINAKLSSVSRQMKLG